MQMSRHISGWLEAIRVKSRNPPAAYPNSCAELSRVAMSRTRAYARRCGRWLTAAKTLSCSCGVIRNIRAPHVRHALSARSSASGAVSSIGAMTTRLPSNRLPCAAAAPLCSAPAIGCAGTKRGSAGPSARCAVATTSCLVLPASVMTASSRITPAIALKTGNICNTGTATSTRSASRAASAALFPISSIAPRSSATRRFSALRPTPTTLPQAFSFFSARANEPPISPTPITATRSKRVTRSFPDAGRERREESLVLVGGADRHTQVLGQLVRPADRAHDDAPLEQALVDLGRASDAHRDEVAVRRNPVEAECSHALLDLAHPLQVVRIAARDE